MDFMRRRNAWLILSILLSIFFWNSHSSGLAETSVVAEPFYVQTITWEENKNASSVKLSIKNQSNSTITDPAVCVCFQDASETIVETSVIQQHGRLRNEQAMIFSASISMSSNPVSAYVDYIQYRGESGEIKTYYFIEPLIAYRSASGMEFSPVPSDTFAAPELSETEAPQLMPQQPSSPDENAPRLELDESFLELVKGKTAFLKPSVLNSNEKKIIYSWESSNPGVAKVSSEGKILAVEGGETTIVCRTVLADGTELSANAAVKVKVPVKALKLTETREITLNAGTSTSLSYTITPENATDQTLDWTSSNPKIASVDMKGTVTAVSPGSVKITGQTRDGSNKKVSISIYVPALVCSVTSAKLDRKEITEVPMKYYGNQWNENVKISKKGNALDYKIEQKGNDVLLSIIAMAVGKGSITIQDKTDPRSRVTIQVQVELSALPLYKQVTIEPLQYDGERCHYRLINNTDEKIIAVGLAERIFDTKGKPLIPDDFGDSSGFDYQNYIGYSYGVRNIHSDLTALFFFVRGSSLKLESEFSGYSDYDHTEFAISEIWTNNGVYSCVDQDELVWISSKTGRYIVTEGKTQKASSYLFRKAKEYYKLGYGSRYYYFDPSNRTYQHSGWEQIEVRDGFLYKIGIRRGDLIYAANSVPADADWLFFTKFSIKLLYGETVFLQVERPGVGLLEFRCTLQGGELIAITPFSDSSASDTAPLSFSLDGTSILGNQIVIELISSCPSIGKSTKPTKEFYASLSEYNRDFPTGKHSWRISIQNGVAYFADENQMTVLLYKPKGTISEIVSVLDWWIKILDALPSVQTFAEQNGISLVAEKRGGEDYAAYADANGVIDLTNQTKREKVLEIMHDNKGILDTLYAVGQGLGSLDTNGNGEIDPYEIFDYGD